MDQNKGEEAAETRTWKKTWSVIINANARFTHTPCAVRMRCVRYRSSTC